MGQPNGSREALEQDLLELVMLSLHSTAESFRESVGEFQIRDTTADHHFFRQVPCTTTRPTFPSPSPSPSHACRWRWKIVGVDRWRKSSEMAPEDHWHRSPEESSLVILLFLSKTHSRRSRQDHNHHSPPAADSSPVNPNYGDAIPTRRTPPLVKFAESGRSLFINSDVIKSSIEKVRDSVAYWTATPKREEQFVESARQLGIDYDRKLALDCPTRWNSTFLMLQTAIEYRSAFARLKLKHRQYKCCPNDDDWYLAQDICERLEIFYRVTLLFSGTSYPTSNLFFPDVCDIKLTLTEWASCGIDLVEEMASKMIEKYDKYWDNTHGFLGVAVVLDPRFKMTLIGYYYKKIYGEKLGEKMAEEVRARCFDLLTLYEGKTNNDNKRFEVTSSSKQPATYLKCKNRLSDFDSYRDNLKKAKTSHVKSELELYLEEEELPRLEESSFSTGGRVVTPSRNRLHPKTLEALMCTQSWLAAFEDGDIPTINDEDMNVDECMSGVTYIDD
ncbi:hypothetical protein Vadar_018820 [Vaccinium darrowii]|uniref:Uncharacterized protein n=1 Tax=Vaccinium darrowii TaxID=229202 RepID=A0ACB7Z4U7_9ERIC|nr:hypothetical protein Vadar_018820 [Vaccinium darrowii]